jgi:Capsule polysaccharide biosynthesis protein
MVTAMYRVIDALTDRCKPDYLLSVTVDNYMTDLLVRICEKKGARPLTLVAGPVANTILLTKYGEFNKVRDPSDAEIGSALDAFLDDDARVTYGQREHAYDFWRQARIFSTWWAKCLFFRASGLLRGDPLNFRYLMGSLPARDGQSSLWGYRCTRFFDDDWSERIAASSKPSLFVPLGYTPEASVSYWLRDTRYIDYENFICDLCSALSGHYQVVIKEHWAALGIRRWPFYKRLQEIRNVVIVPASVNSREVMRRVERVLVGAGTAGIEAALRGKRVVTLDRPYYHVDGHFLGLGSVERIPQLPTLLESFRFSPPTPPNQRQIVRRALETTLIGHMLPDDRMNTEANFAAASRSLKMHLSDGEA